TNADPWVMLIGAGMLRAIRIVLLCAGVTISAQCQDPSQKPQRIEKTLTELDKELRHIQRVLQELSRQKTADSSPLAPSPASPVPRVEAKPDLELAQDAYLRGKIAEERHQYEAALEAFSKAIELSPKSEVYYFRRGRVYFELGAPHLALRDLDRSLLIQ